jgi:acyl carrier protein
MTEEEAATVLAEALREVAPEADFEAVDLAQPLQESLDIDSRDFLTLLAAVQRRAGVEIAPSDYPKLATTGSLLAYLTSAAAGRPTARRRPADRRRNADRPPFS